MTKEKDLWVHSYRMPPDSNNSIKMEVGIEDCLHIEFEYNKSKCVYFIRLPAAHLPLLPLMRGRIASFILCTLRPSFLRLIDLRVHDVTVD